MCIHCLLSISREETMERMKLRNVTGGVAILTMALGLGSAGRAQDQTQEPSRETTTPAPEQLRQKADGERHGLPIETYAVAPGTKFLVRLEDELGTKGTQENAKFKVKTLEPLEAGSGIYLPAGAEIRGHISHVEPAGVAGVSGAPGIQGGNGVPNNEGVNRGRGSTELEREVASGPRVVHGAENCAN